MKRLFALQLLFFLFLFCIPCKAASKQYHYQQIATRDGLSFTVRCLTVSNEKGYVWIGTRSGIGRFDGYELKKYLNHNVTHILEDREHTIWAITAKGVFYYDYASDEFLQARDKDNNPILASSICSWPDGILFGGNGRLYKYSYAEHQTSLFKFLNPNNKYNITNLYRWDNHTLLCTNRWASALLVDLNTGRTRPTPFDSQELIATHLDKEGNIWVAPYNQGVKCYHRSGRLLHAYDTRNSGLRSNVVLSLAEHDGNIWIGTDGAGIHLLNPRDGSISILEQLSDDPHSLSVKSVLCLYKDENNSMWAGSIRNGLINIKEAGMKAYSNALPGQNYGLSEKTVLCLYQDSESPLIWIGTDGGGINRLEPSTGKFTHVLSTGGNKIASITGMDSHHLLVSIFGKGLFVFDKRKGSCQPFTIVNDSINAALCFHGKAVNTYQNSAEEILLLSSSPYKYLTAQKKFIPILGKKSPLQVTGNLLLIGADHRACYLYDLKCIYRLDHADNRLNTLYETRQDTVINSVSIDENGIFWIGSNYGLSYYSPSTRQRVNIPNSLIAEITSLICDKRGRVWIGAGGMLFAHLIREGEFILFDESDGVIPNEYLEKPRLLSVQGDIYMGGVSGLLRINKVLPKERDLIPVLELADIRVGGERVNHLLTSAHHLEVEGENKTVFIKISAHGKDVFRKPMFRYTLTGNGTQTIDSYQPELTLSALRTGTYIIRAAYSTRSGGWTDDRFILSLTILPPWYQSGWFITCCVLFVLAGVVAVFVSFWRRQENKMKWAMKEHEQQVYEEKVRFLININHELRTPLTLIHAPLKQLLESLSAGDSKYPVIQSICKQSARMKNLLNMVLDVRKMEVGRSTLNSETVELNSWVEQLIADFRPEAGGKGIILVYEAAAESPTLCFDQEKCTVILTNLLINALKYSPDGSTVTVRSALSENGQMRISVSDQGPGLKDVDVSNLFIRFYQGNNSRPGTGIGLSYSKILVEQHGGHIGAYDNEVTAGSTFWFELPPDLQPGKITLEPQPYLNELLAPVQEVEALPAPSDTSSNTRECTLLVVDDNPDLTDYLAGALKDKFKQIRIAADGEEALRMCREFLPSVVVSDIQMPRMNGYELCKRIKEDLTVSHTPVILLTARNDSESQLYGYKNGADAYLTKPFEVDILYASICSQLKSRCLMRTRYAGAGSLPLPKENTFSSADEKFLQQLNKVITDHLDDEQMGIPFLCKELGVSRASLYNKLKVLTDMGANDYLTKIRMERAIWLITRSELSVNDIADQTGFSTSRYFSTVFKQYTGCSPTQYKEQQREETNNLFSNE